MKLSLSPKLEQQQILAPQMILSMDILLLNSIDLENRIDKEFIENPALELDEVTPDPMEPVASEERSEVQEIYDLIDHYESRYGGDEAPRKRSGMSSEEDGKYEALSNTAARAQTLTEHLRQQIRFRDLDVVLAEVCWDLAGEVDQRGYLLGSPDEIASALSVPLPLAERAIRELQQLDPPGVGARDLQECLLLQLGRDSDCLESRIVRDHLNDLLENRLPRIAEKLQVSLDEVKEAVELIALLDPHPGAQFDDSRDGVAIPEIFVEDVGGKLTVRVDEEVLPHLRVSPALSQMLKDGGHQPQVREFIRAKLEAARWLIHAIDQRRRTVIDIAESIVKHQESFFRSGPGNLEALTMQTVADEVGVHISTVSRATNGKFIQSEYGVFELRRFFTGGVERASGGIESRDNVCRLIQEIVQEEDPAKPLSDTQLARALQDRGIEIARRTVSKYRERAGVPTARLRRRY